MLSHGSSSLVQPAMGLRLTMRFLAGAALFSVVTGTGAAAGLAAGAVAVAGAAAVPAGAAAVGAAGGFAAAALAAGGAVAAGMAGAAAGGAATGAAGAVGVVTAGFAAAGALSCAKADPDTAMSSASPRVWSRVMFASRVGCGAAVASTWSNQRSSALSSPPLSNCRQARRSHCVTRGAGANRITTGNRTCAVATYLRQLFR